MHRQIHMLGKRTFLSTHDIFSHCSKNINISLPFAQSLSHLATRESQHGEDFTEVLPESNSRPRGSRPDWETQTHANGGFAQVIWGRVLRPRSTQGKQAYDDILICYFLSVCLLTDFLFLIFFPVTSILRVGTSFYI